MGAVHVIATGEGILQACNRRGPAAVTTQMHIFDFLHTMPPLNATTPAPMYGAGNPTA